MATMITAECINCGACEPECPNNAISQGEEIYVIDPLLCTECVGFHDYEACAAVCPVDCCVTDPNNVETEEVLIARARQLHPEVAFGEEFESRFRKGAGKAAAAKRGAMPAAAEAAPEPSASGDSEAAAPAAASLAEDLGAELGELPEPESWEVPLRCFRCQQRYSVPVRHFLIGNVLFCPHCHRSFVVKDSLSFAVRAALKEARESWERSRAELEAKRQRELAEFLERRQKELAAFREKERQAVERLKRQLETIAEAYDAPGKPKRRSLLGWG